MTWSNSLRTSPDSHHDLRLLISLWEAAQRPGGVFGPPLPQEHLKIEPVEEMWRFNVMDEIEKSDTPLDHEKHDPMR